MGAWGAGSFDNDDAADWAWGLTPAADEGVVSAALTAVDSDPHPDASAAQAAIAAAEVVAAGLGRPAADLPDEVAEWVASRMDRPWASIAPLALRAIAGIVAGSELRDLWAESGDEAWIAGVDSVRDRLAPATT